MPAGQACDPIPNAPVMVHELGIYDREGSELARHRLDRIYDVCGSQIIATEATNDHILLETSKDNIDLIDISQSASDLYVEQSFIRPNLVLNYWAGNVSSVMGYYNGKVFLEMVSFRVDSDELVLTQVVSLEDNSSEVIKIGLDDISPLFAGYQYTGQQEFWKNMTTSNGYMISDIEIESHHTSMNYPWIDSWITVGNESSIYESGELVQNTDSISHWFLRYDIGDQKIDAFRYYQNERDKLDEYIFGIWPSGDGNYSAIASYDKDHDYKVSVYDWDQKIILHSLALDTDPSYMLLKNQTLWIGNQGEESYHMFSYDLKDNSLHDEGFKFPVTMLTDNYLLSLVTVERDEGLIAQLGPGSLEFAILFSVSMLLPLYIQKRRKSI